jgi:predicted RNA-binding Zn-ribbon protein involved in translation (DUF1610 family)
MCGDDDYPDPMHDGPDMEPPPGEECPECGEEMELNRKRTEWYCSHCDTSTDYEPPEPPDPYDDDYPIDGVGFADPGGRSALRAATRNNPRDRPCPNCGTRERPDADRRPAGLPVRPLCRPGGEGVLMSRLYDVCFAAHCGMSYYIAMAVDAEEAKAVVRRRNRAAARKGLAVDRVQHKKLTWEHYDAEGAGLIGDDQGLLYIRKHH